MNRLALVREPRYQVCQELHRWLSPEEDRAKFLKII